MTPTQAITPTRGKCGTRWRGGHELRVVLALATLGLAPALGAGPAAAQDRSAATLQEMIVTGRHPWSAHPDFQRHAESVARLYREFGDRLIWVPEGQVSPVARMALDQLDAAAGQGLRPGDYDAPMLDSVAKAGWLETAAAADLARFDLLLSLALIRYLDDLHSGRAPSALLGSTGIVRERWDPSVALAQAVAGDSIAGLVAAAEPPFAQYRNLRLLLARYRGLAGAGIQPSFPAERVVHSGERYAKNRELTRFLVALGDLAAAPARGDALYQGSIVAGVEKFQVRHGLLPDGVLGPATFRALNTPLSTRVLQIELALERLRWLPEMRGRRFVVVNIPAFELFAFDSAGGSGAPTLEMRVIVGRSLRSRTPPLLEELRYVEFQPYWYVPRSILLHEILPRLHRETGYLRSHEMEVLSGDHVLGDSVTARVLRGLASGALSIRQRPGSRNPLGPVKFVLPNAAAVYLHGTPEPELFSETRRDFSHGCVRVEEPAELAWWVLQDRPGWTRDSVTQAMCASETTRDSLPQPMPVIIFYTTAVARPDGSGWFYEDIYQNDGVVARRLKAD